MLYRHKKDHAEPRGFSYAYRDLLLSLLIVYAALAALSLLAAQKITSSGLTQGDLVIEMHWQQDRAADVDLWMKAPDDSVIGYSRMGSSHCNLLRDDLGHPTDGSLNEEMVVCRQAQAGEYVIDAMLYRSTDGMYPVKVDISVSKTGDGGTSVLTENTVILTRQGDQQTATRFSLDSNGQLVSGSVNQIPMMLYNTAGP